MIVFFFFKRNDFLCLSCLLKNGHSLFYTVKGKREFGRSTKNNLLYIKNKKGGGRIIYYFSLLDEQLTSSLNEKNVIICLSHMF